jgi:hypothetical protein
MSLPSSNSLFGLLELSYKAVYYINDDNNNYLISYNLLKWSWQFKDITRCLFPASLNSIQLLIMLPQSTEPIISNTFPQCNVQNRHLFFRKKQNLSYSIFLILDSALPIDWRVPSFIGQSPAGKERLTLFALTRIRTKRNEASVEYCVNLTLICWSLSGRGLLELPNIRSNDWESWRTSAWAS